MAYRYLLNSSTIVARPLQLVQWTSILIIVIASFIPGDLVAPGRWNAGHLPAYLILTLISLFLGRHTLRRPGAIVRVALAISSLGLAIELLQPLSGRTTSVVDFALNESGVVLGITIYVLLMLSAKLVRPRGTHVAASMSQSIEHTKSRN